MHDDAIEAINLEQLATMTDRLLLRARRGQRPVVAPSRLAAKPPQPSVIVTETTADRFSVPSLARSGRQARVSPPLTSSRGPSHAWAPSPSRASSSSRSPRGRSAPAARLGATVHGYAPAPRGPEVAPPVAHEAFPHEPATVAVAYDHAPRTAAVTPTIGAVARGSSPKLAWRTQRAAPPPAPRPVEAARSDAFEPERTVCVRPLPSPVPISLATRIGRALRSPSFAAKILLPALVGAALGLAAML